jgi:hypothetical protein
MSILRPNPNGYLEDYKMMLFDFTLDYVKKYIQDTAKIIEKEQEDISIKIKVYDRENPEDKQEVIWDDELGPIGGYSGFDAYEGEVMKYHEFIKILNSSTLVSIYAFLEHSLRDISTSTGFFRKKKIMPKDNYIQKSKKYIEKVSEIDISDLENYWQKVIEFQRIRNLIVHNESNYRVDENKPIEKQQCHNLITNFKGIGADNYGNFYIYDKDVLLGFCKLIEEFLDKLIDKLKVHQ